MARSHGACRIHLSGNCVLPEGRNIRPDLSDPALRGFGSIQYRGRCGEKYLPGIASVSGHCVRFPGRTRNTTGASHSAGTHECRCNFPQARRPCRKAGKVAPKIHQGQSNCRCVTGAARSAPYHLSLITYHLSLITYHGLQIIHPNHSQTPLPITYSRSCPFSQGSSAVKKVTPCR